ncbi:MAG: hypothetical protein U1F09_15590 [Steroidobacteraceae bacterium]
MSGRIRNVSGHRRVPLGADWEFCSVPPGTILDPAALPADGVDWIGTSVPCTAASALAKAGRWSLDGPPRRFDDSDWWFRTEFPAPVDLDGRKAWLVFEGLATIAEVWLNGHRLLNSENMFVGHEIPVDGLLAQRNRLAMRFRSIDALLKQRRPRPRWRTPMVENQQLRWIRTTLLGRTPGWSPPAAPVGPWREVRLELRGAVCVEDLRVRATVHGGAGRLEVSCRIEDPPAGAAGSVELAVARGGRVCRAALAATGTPGAYTGHVSVPDADLWWPHTHGEPATYDAWLDVRPVAGSDNPVRVDIGPIGFRSLVVDTSGGDFSIQVNGVPVFCRGACWTPPDPVSLVPSSTGLADAIAQVRAAGMNMLRVCGPMVYEGSMFFDLCDANGILVWQDLMFANMDYPGDDEAFVASVREECRQVFDLLQGHASVAVICGNSEVEQQAAMSAATRDRWSPGLFHETIQALAAEHLEGVPYWPSSAHGGAFPHQGNVGTTSYYGVGAYLRGLDDARRADVRFATECLGFANVPEPSGLDAMPGGQSLRVHHPGWKARTPRDLGAGWDFDDVRDHYLGRAYGLDPVALRYADHDRYLELGRAVTGQVMAATFGEWRRSGSSTRGALVWFLRDLWPGAGWGLIDASGTPKAAYYMLRRALQPVGLFLSDEGGNGVFADVVNDRLQPLVAALEVVLYRQGHVAIARASRGICVDGRAAVRLAVADLLEGFFDLSYAYRFGPPSHDLIATRLRAPDGIVLARTTYFPGSPSASRMADLGLTAIARSLPGGDVELTLEACRFASAVRIDAAGHDPSDNYLDLHPGDPQVVRLRPRTGTVALTGSVQALNGESPVRITTTA